MISRYKHKDLIWIDLESPTAEEARTIGEEFQIHPMVARELSIPSMRPRVELYRNFVYLILHFPELGRGKIAGPTRAKEVDFVIGKNFIITTRFDAIDPLHQFSKIFEVNSILDKGEMGEHAGFVFYLMITKLYEAMLHELEAVKDGIQRIEERVFKGEERAMVVSLSQMSRILLDFRRAISAHKETLESFSVAGKKFFGGDFEYHLQSITGEYYKVRNAVRDNMESVMELRDTNNSLLNTKQNEVMKTLTIMAFVMLPLSFIASLYSMNTKTIPLVGVEHDFWIVLLVMSAVALFIIGAFKWKKWL